MSLSSNENNTSPSSVATPAPTKKDMMLVKPRFRTLSTVSTGLLDTHVTWAEVEYAMQAAFSTKATFGMRRTVVSCLDDGDTTSRLGVVLPDWKNGNEHLPEKFLIKICTMLSNWGWSATDKENDIRKNSLASALQLAEQEKQEEMVMNLHNIEVEMYEKMCAEPVEDMPVPKLYASRRFDSDNLLKGYIIMESSDDWRDNAIFSSRSSSNSVSSSFSSCLPPLIMSTSASSSCSNSSIR